MAMTTEEMESALKMSKMKDFWLNMDDNVIGMYAKMMGKYGDDVSYSGVPWAGMAGRMGDAAAEISRGSFSSPVDGVLPSPILGTPPGPPAVAAAPPPRPPAAPVGAGGAAMSHLDRIKAMGQ